MELSYFAGAASARVPGRQNEPFVLTLSQASIPRLGFLPPFCISLSLPTDTALKANICRRQYAPVAGGRGH